MRRRLASFSRLQWKLTLAYTLFTALASAVLVGAFMTAVGIAIFRSDVLPQALAEALAAKTEEVRPALLAASPNRAEVRRWLKELGRRGNWQVINSGVFQFSVNLGEGGDAVLAVFDADGNPLGVNRAGVDPASSPLAIRLLQSALAGQSVPETLNGQEAGWMFAAAPIFDDRDRVAGALVVQVSNDVEEEGIFWFAAVLGTLLPTLCFFTPLAGAVGLVFGYLTARGLTRRIGSVAHASEAWSRGDFSMFVKDGSGDELGQLSRRLNTMAQQLQNLLKAKQDLAVLEERNRLALDLHDSVKQQAFAASAQLGAARALFRQNPSAAEARLVEAERLIDGLRQELAHLILELRPPVLGEKGLVTALGEYAAEWSRQSNLLAEVQASGERALAPEVEGELFRIAQEALANVARHSQATRVEVALVYDSTGVTLTVADNGRGFAPDLIQSGVGQRSMRERAEALHGTLMVESALGQGTSVRVQINDEPRNLK
jgi:NarL family two-component system sensor histidine kinase LiaS